jgi:glutathione S-transferase
VGEPRRARNLLALTMAPIDLYLLSGSAYAWRVHLALEHKGIPYQATYLSHDRGETKSPAYRALNPRGRVPTIVDGDTVVYESLAILAYLEHKVPAPPLFGTTAREVGTVWRVIAEYGSYLDDAIEDFLGPMYAGTAAAHADAVRAAIAVITAELARYEVALSKTAYLAGDSPTAADLVVFPHVQSLLRAAGKPAAKAFDVAFLPLGDKFPAVEAWRQSLEALPYYDRTYPPHWR